MGIFSTLLNLGTRGAQNTVQRWQTQPTWQTGGNVAGPVNQQSPGTFQKVDNILNPYDANTLQSSYEQPGGLLGLKQYSGGVSAGTGSITDTGEQQLLGGGEGGTGEGGTTFQPRYFQNVYYTDPNLYTQAVQDAINAEYGNQYDLGQRSYSQQRQGLNQSQENLGYDFTNNLANLQTALGDTLGSQAGYFSAISPEAYQSQQGSYADRTNEEFGRGQTDLTRQRDQGNEAIAQAQGNLNLDETGYYQGLEQARTNLLDELLNTTTDYNDPINLGQNIIDRQVQLGPLNSQAGLAGIAGQNTGLGQTQQQRSAQLTSFKNMGLSDSQIAALEAYLYGA